MGERSLCSMRDGNGEVAGPGMWEGEGQFVGCSSTVACSCLSHVTVCHIYLDAVPVTLLVSVLVWYETCTEGGRSSGCGRWGIGQQGALGSRHTRKHLQVCVVAA
jgi:hypothetical protein